PHNVMIGNDGRLKVLDFGLARIDGPSADPAGTTVTGRGVVFGTPAYMAPEQAQGLHVDHRADLFSLGVILFEMTTGQLPFSASSDVGMVVAVLRDEPPPVTQVNPGLPRRLARLVQRCLEKDPARRYQSAIDLRADLEDLRDETGADSWPSAPRPPSGDAFV